MGRLLSGRVLHQGWESLLTTYHISVNGRDETYADAHGDLDTINYIGKRVAKVIEGVGDDVTVKLVETSGIGGVELRSVLSITADGETAAVMLQRKLRSERKANTPAAESVTV
jgi:hypothetical protein